MWVDTRRELPWKPPVAMIVDLPRTFVTVPSGLRMVAPRMGEVLAVDAVIRSVTTVLDFGGGVLKYDLAPFGNESLYVNMETNYDRHNTVESGGDADALITHPLNGIEMF